MGKRIYSKQVTCMFCGRLTHTISGHSEAEIRRSEHAYKICTECSKDPEKVAQWGKSEVK
jgi:hypothetical protein